jgi:hypothetical protein
MNKSHMLPICNMTRTIQYATWNATNNMMHRIDTTGPIVRSCKIRDRKLKSFQSIKAAKLDTSPCTCKLAPTK